MDTGHPKQTRERRAMLGARMLRYVCSCGYGTGWWADDYDDAAQAQMAEHLLTAHPEHAPCGPCAVCGRRTDYFHADSAHGRLWLCERDAPAMPEQGGEVTRDAG